MAPGVPYFWSFCEVICFLCDFSAFSAHFCKVLMCFCLVLQRFFDVFICFLRGKWGVLLGVSVLILEDEPRVKLGDWAGRGGLFGGKK